MNPPIPLPKFLLPLCVGIVSSLLTGSAIASSVLTTTQGNVSVNGANAAQNASIDIGDTVEVEGSGVAAILVGNNAVVRMCHGAALGFGNDSGDGPSTLSLRGGQLKVSAGKRPSDRPLEIHTPAAIATLMGTQVHVSVDEATGATTVTSLEHQIKIAGSGAGDPTVISPGEQVTISSDGVVGQVESAPLSILALSSDCLDGQRYRSAAVKTAVRNYADRSIDEIAAMDTQVDVPQVAAGPPLIPTGTLGAPLAVPPCLAAVQCAGSEVLTSFDLVEKVPDGVPAGPPGGPPGGP